MQGINLSRYKKIIQWLLTAACLIYIILFFSKNSQELKLLGHLNPTCLIALTGLIFLGFIIFTWRFHLVLKKCTNKSVPFLPWLKMMALGRFLSTIAPQAGNIYRSVMLKQNYQIPHTYYAGSLFSLTWMDTAFNLILAAVIMLVLQPEMRLGGLGIWLLLVLLATGIILVPVLLELFFRRLRFQNLRLAWLHAKLSEMLRISVTSLTDGSYVIKFVLTGVVAFINTVAAFYLCFLSLGIQVNLPVLALFYVILKLSNQIIITPGNLGVLEITYGLLSQYMQIGMAQGIMVSFLVRFVSTLVVIVLGIFFGGRDLLHQRHKFTQKKKENLTSD
jgi:uncharacterized protein (TIRG00374 family)